MDSLRAQAGLGGLALELAILTATRTGEVIDARWSEIDLHNAIWTIPPERMKAGKEHRIPLSDGAMAVVRELAQFREVDKGDSFVFAAAWGNRGKSPGTG